MPNTTKVNKSDDDKKNKQKPNQLLGDLNTTHIISESKKKIATLSQSAQKTMQVATSQQLDSEAWAKLDQKFPGLINDTNILAEQVKKLQTIKIPAYKERYKVSNEKVTLPSLRPDLDKILRAKHKKFFLEFEKALDNTYIIDAYPHEATLFKVGLLYAVYLNYIFSPRVIEMSIAIRNDDLPDRFKYMGDQGKYRAAEWIELGQQAYDEIKNGGDESLKQRFSESCEKFKKVCLGLNEPKQVTDDIPENDINFPEIPNHLPESNNDANEIALFKLSTTTYVNFTGTELTTLQFLIPEHKKNGVFIPEIGGISLAEFMRECLSRQVSVKAETSDLRKRTAADKFILKVCDIVGDAQRAIHSDKKGQIFDPHQGYVSYHADPANTFKEIKKEHEKYQEELIITEDCHLSAQELTEKFFVKMITSLKLGLESEQKSFREEYEKAKAKTSIFDKRKLKSEYEKNLSRTKEKYQQASTEMHNFQVIVEKVGAVNIKIFAAEPGGKASYSIPKNFLVNNDRTDATVPSASSTPSTIAARR